MKHIDTNTSESGPIGESGTQTRDSIEIIKNELVRYHGDIRDEDLRHRVQRWLLEANEVPGGDLESYVTGRLSEIRRDNAMYQQRKHDDGAEAFPEACQDCPHYGSRCPVLTDNTQINRRKRLLEKADGADDIRHSLREYAIDNECVVLLDVLERLSDHHEPLLRRGIMLLVAVEESMVFSGEEQVSRLKAALDQLDEDSTADVIGTLSPDDAGDGVSSDAPSATGADTGDVSEEMIEAEMERLTDGGAEAKDFSDDDPWGFGSITPKDTDGDPDADAAEETAGGFEFDPETEGGD